jgi:hypothetical protein
MNIKKIKSYFSARSVGAAKWFLKICLALISVMFFGGGFLIGHWTDESKVGQLTLIQTINKGIENAKNPEPKPIAQIFSDDSAEALADLQKSTIVTSLNSLPFNKQISKEDVEGIKIIYSALRIRGAQQISWHIAREAESCFVDSQTFLENAVTTDGGMKRLRESLEKKSELNGYLRWADNLVNRKFIFPEDAPKHYIVKVIEERNVKTSQLQDQKTMPNRAIVNEKVETSAQSLRLAFISGLQIFAGQDKKILSQDAKAIKVIAKALEGSDGEKVTQYIVKEAESCFTNGEKFLGKSVTVTGGPARLLDRLEKNTDLLGLMIYARFLVEEKDRLTESERQRK